MNIGLKGILKQVGSNLGVSYKNLKELIDSYAWRDVIINRADSNKKRGWGQAELNAIRCKISCFNLVKGLNYIDEKHAKCTTVRCRMLQVFLENQCGVTVSRHTVRLLLKKCGFRYKAPKKKRTLDADRINFIRGCLVKFSMTIKRKRTGPMSVFTWTNHLSTQIIPLGRDFTRKIKGQIVQILKGVD